METQLAELVGFLVDPKPEVRQIALQSVRDFTATNEGRALLTSTPIVRHLVRLLNDANKAIATLAYSNLINLSESPDYARTIIDTSRLCSALARTAVDPSFERGEVVLLLLCNLTRLEEGCKELFQVGEDTEGYYLEKLMEVFFEKRGDGKRDPFGWVATILMNVTQLSRARTMLLERDRGVMQQLVKETRHENIIRRRGCIGTIKNCCFDSSSHAWLLAEDGADILPHLLYPLVGPEPFTEDEKEGMPASLANLGSDKRREPDTESRKMLVAILALLTLTKPGRETMRKKKVYPIVRNMHQEEDNEEIGESLYLIVDALIRDEEPEAAIGVTNESQKQEDGEEKEEKKEKEKENEKAT